MDENSFAVWKVRPRSYGFNIPQKGESSKLLNLMDSEVTEKQLNEIACSDGHEDFHNIVENLRRILL